MNTEYALTSKYVKDLHNEMSQGNPYPEVKKPLDQLTNSELCQMRDIAVYKVRDVYGTEPNKQGRSIPLTELDKWFVSSLAESPLVSGVREIPLADTYAEAEALAVEHFGLRLNKEN